MKRDLEMCHTSNGYWIWSIHYVQWIWRPFTFHTTHLSSIVGHLYDFLVTLLLRGAITEREAELQISRYGMFACFYQFHLVIIARLANNPNSTVFTQFLVR